MLASSNGASEPQLLGEHQCGGQSDRSPVNWTRILDGILSRIRSRIRSRILKLEFLTERVVWKVDSRLFAICKYRPDQTPLPHCSIRPVAILPLRRSLGISLPTSPKFELQMLEFLTWSTLKRIVFGLEDEKLILDQKSKLKLSESRLSH